MDGLHAEPVQDHHRLSQGPVPWEADLLLQMWDWLQYEEVWAVCQVNNSDGWWAGLKLSKLSFVSSNMAGQEDKPA